MKPLVCPIFLTTDQHERIAPAVHIDGQTETLGWQVQPGYIRAVNLAETLIDRHQATRLVHLNNFAYSETRTPDLGGVLDPVRAALTGDIPLGDTRTMIAGMVSGIRRLGQKPAVYVVNVETGFGAIVDAMIAHSNDRAFRRRMPHAVGCALANASFNPENAYGSGCFNALMSVLWEYAGVVVSRLIDDLMRPLMPCQLAVSYGGFAGGKLSRVIPSTAGAPVPPIPLPRSATHNAPQLYAGKVAPADLGIDSFDAWRTLLASVECVRANVGVGINVLPFIAGAPWSVLNRPQLESLFGHLARSAGSPVRVPMWNQNAPPGEVAWCCDAWTRACAGTDSNARCGDAVDFGADFITTGNLTTTRAEFEALRI